MDLNSTKKKKTLNDIRMKLYLRKINQPTKNPEVYCLKLHLLMPKYMTREKDSFRSRTS